MTYWIKLYTEILNDPKIGRLTPQLKWRFTEALLLAGSEERDGYLPDLIDAAYMAHAPEAELLEDWRTLESVGLLVETDDGWMVTNFAKRQAPSDVTERVRLHRERKMLLERYGNISVTTPDIESDTDTEQNRTELREDIEPPGEFERVKSLIEKHTGMASMPKDVPALQELAALEDLQEQDIVGAIAWNRQQGRVVYGASALLGSVKYNRASRIQAGARASPSNGRKKTGILEAELAKLAAEKAAQNGDT